MSEGIELVLQAVKDYELAGYAYTDSLTPKQQQDLGVTEHSDDPAHTIALLGTYSVVTDSDGRCHPCLDQVCLTHGDKHLDLTPKNTNLDILIDDIECMGDHLEWRFDLEVERTQEAVDAWRER